jgi:hypothetical protein
MTTVLNLGAGKDEMEYNDVPIFAVSVDKSFYIASNPKDVEHNYIGFKNGAVFKRQHYRIDEDIFTFLERTIMKFDRVRIFRFLEHVPFTRVNYFFYLLASVMRKGSIANIAVPDYKILAQMILDEDVNDRDFEKHNITVTTELLNEPYDPHASIWTKERAKYYGEFEGRFKFRLGEPDHINIDGRDLYLHFCLERL